MRVFLAFASIGLLAGCGNPADGTYETEDGTVTLETDTSGGETEMRMTDEDGNEAVYTTGANADIDLPAGFTIYPGADVTSTTALTGNDGQGAMVMMSSEASPADMMAHYRKQAEAAGIEIQMEMKSGETSVIAGESPDGVSFTFNATPNGAVTNGTLMIGKE